MNRAKYSRQILFPPIGADGQEKLLESKAVILGCGALGTAQANALARAGVGTLRIVDRDLAMAWPGRFGHRDLEALHERGYQTVLIPDEQEALIGSVLNFVTLGPRQILMPAHNPVTRAFYEGLGIVCHTVQVDELKKAAGAIGCLTGVLQRDAG